MRAIFGVLGLLVVVALVGMLAKKQLSPTPVQVAPADASVTLPAPVAGASPQQQIQQVRQALENTLQQARQMPDDK
jgi:multidrug efflux pump subunit AcrB